MPHPESLFRVKYPFSTFISFDAMIISDLSNEPEGVNPSPKLIFSSGKVDHVGLISDKLYSITGSFAVIIQPCSTICWIIPAYDAAIGVAILVPLDDLRALFIESSIPSALAELIDTPGASAKIP